MGPQPCTSKHQAMDTWACLRPWTGSPLSVSVYVPPSLCVPVSIPVSLLVCTPRLFVPPTLSSIHVSPSSLFVVCHNFTSWILVAVRVILCCDPQPKIHRTLQSILLALLPRLCSSLKQWNLKVWTQNHDNSWWSPWHKPRCSNFK